MEITRGRRSSTFLDDKRAILAGIVRQLTQRSIHCVTNDAGADLLVAFQR